MKASMLTVLSCMLILSLASCSQGQPAQAKEYRDCPSLMNALRTISSNLDIVIASGLKCDVNIAGQKTLKLYGVSHVKIRGATSANRPSLNFIDFQSPGFDIKNSDDILIENLSITFRDQLYAPGKVTYVAEEKYTIELEHLEPLQSGHLDWLAKMPGCKTSSYLDILACSYNNQDLLYMDVFNATGPLTHKSHGTLYRVLKQSLYQDDIRFSADNGKYFIRLMRSNPLINQLDLQLNDTIGFQPMRGANAINIREGSSRIRITNVNIFESPNVAINDYFSKELNGYAVKLRNVNIAPEECIDNNTYNPLACQNSSALFSANKAGIHSRGSEKGPIIVNSNFVRTGDDPVNVHGWFYKATSFQADTPDPGKTSFAITHADGTPLVDERAFEVGEKVELYDINQKIIADQANVYAVNVTEKGTTIVFQNAAISKVQQTSQYYLIPTNAEGSNAEVTNSTFAFTKRGIVMRSENAKLINNDFSSIAIVGIWIGAELGPSFFEGRFPSIPEIRNNSFTHIGFNADPSLWGPVTFKVNQDHQPQVRNCLLTLKPSLISGNTLDNIPYTWKQMFIANSNKSNYPNDECPLD